MMLIAVFKYDPPTPKTFPHSVYAQMQGNPKQGAGEGFEFVLKTSQPHYFACGEHNGIHCLNGTMKFFVTPIDRSLR